jgi:hypothetical protein
MTMAAELNFLIKQWMLLGYIINTRLVYNSTGYVIPRERFYTKKAKYVPARWLLGLPEEVGCPLCRHI